MGTTFVCGNGSWRLWGLKFLASLNQEQNWMGNGPWKDALNSKKRYSRRGMFFYRREVFQALFMIMEAGNWLWTTNTGILAAWHLPQNIRQTYPDSSFQFSLSLLWCVFRTRSSSWRQERGSSFTVCGLVSDFMYTCTQVCVMSLFDR